MLSGKWRPSCLGLNVLRHQLTSKGNPFKSYFHHGISYTGKLTFIMKWPPPIPSSQYQSMNVSYRPVLENKHGLKFLAYLNDHNSQPLLTCKAEGKGAVSRSTASGMLSPTSSMGSSGLRWDASFLHWDLTVSCRMLCPGRRPCSWRSVSNWDMVSSLGNGWPAEDHEDVINGIALTQLGPVITQSNIYSLMD